MGLMRIPYTDPLPLPRIIPSSAATRSGAVAALADFLTASSEERGNGQTVLLTGAGISVASGLNDYRGPTGTYVVNKSYRPIYYHEFLARHEARKRYWARSFLGWTSLENAKPNAVHWAIKRLGDMGRVSSVITQTTDVDSFHPLAHPTLPTTELHGYLRSTICLTCSTLHPRTSFQTSLARLNPAWAAFLTALLANDALTTDDPSIRAAKGLRTNPDGDVDLPGAPYTTFRYPPCPVCAAHPPLLPSGLRAAVRIDMDGAYLDSSTAGVLKPAVVMFGESIPAAAKDAAEDAVAGASRLLVVGSSLATYSAWRLVKRAKELGLGIGVVNLGGVRGEEILFKGVGDESRGRMVRCSVDVQDVLPEVVRVLEERDRRILRR